jgi:hypothetical protein
MRRVPMFVAAGVTTAIIVLGINALAPVSAQESARTDLATRFADCMRDRGVAVPARQGAALDRWLKSADLPIDDARACKTALAGVAEKDTPADAVKLATCLRAQGFDVPAGPDRLKAWIARQDKAAIARAMEDCGAAGPEPSCGESKAFAGGTRFPERHPGRRNRGGDRVTPVN